MATTIATTMLVAAAAASSPVGLTYLREPDVRDVVHGCAEAPLAGPAKAAHAVLRALGAERLAARVRLASATADAAREGDERARRVQLELRDPRLLDAAASEIILLDRLDASALPRAEFALAVGSGRDAESSRASARVSAQGSERGYAAARGAADDDSPRAGAASGAALVDSLKTGAASILVAARTDTQIDRRTRRAGAPSLLAAAPASPRREAVPLPPRWYAAYDQASGRTYYWHEDGRTTWTRPSVSAPSAIAADKGARKQPTSKASESQSRMPESAAATGRAGKVETRPGAGKAQRAGAAMSAAATPSGQPVAGAAAEGLVDESAEPRPGVLGRMRARFGELRVIDDSTSKNGSLKKTAAMFALLLVAAAGVL